MTTTKCYFYSTVIHHSGGAEHQSGVAEVKGGASPLDAYEEVTGLVRADHPQLRQVTIQFLQFNNVT